MASADWLAAYRKATRDEIRFRLKAEASADQRALTLGALHQSGLSYGKIAKEIGLSRSRVQQLVERSYK